MRPPWRRSRRRLHVYGIGSPKSGTHSLAGVFATNYRTAHEPEALAMVEQIVASIEGRRSDAELRAFLRERERRLDLEVNCAGLNGLVVEHLIEVAPDARYVLTLRDPYDWLASLIDHSLRGDPAEAYVRLRALRYGADLVHPPEEAELAALGLYTLDGYLASWAERNERALTAVPVDRLLVVRTDQLADRLDDLAAFVGVPVDTLDRTKTHQYAAPERSGVLDRVDPDHVRARVEHHGRALLERFFPERLG